MIYPETPHLYIRTHVEPNSVSWRSPSNIALVKYWGKHGDQFPQNPSLSFTLTEAYTESTVAYQKRQDPSSGIELTFSLDGQRNQMFEARLIKYFQKLLPWFPFLTQLDFDIKSTNSFPHSVGIASSASGMSAISLCLCTIEHQLFQTLDDDQDFRQKASHIARLGSGSACRSIYREVALWGQTGLVSGASNEYAIPIEAGIDPIFRSFHDAILIVDQREKSVSSSTGHSLMEQHPFAPIRYQEARRNLHKILDAMRTGALDDFGRICEMEAMQLHALMMCSNPSYMLLHPNSVKIMSLIREFRRTTGLPAYFTLDAGPNIHLLYPSSCKVDVENFIENILVEYCHSGAWIADRVGPGPLQM